MTNLTKWLVAVPFAALIAFILPGLIAGELLWFSDDWVEIAYVSLTGGMWLLATAFVDVNRPRGKPDLANRLLPLGLILSVPAAVWDRTHWLASRLPGWLSLAGAAIGLAAVVIGVSARRALGAAYAPRAGHQPAAGLVADGPYRWIRHPIYLAAVLWSIGWPMLIASLAGSLTALFFILPGIHSRIGREEADLIQVFGEAYRDYQERTWRLIPGLY